MRVITGTARGKRLKELPGLDTRPTTDRVKEGLFNIIQFDIEGRRVLDLFAGTGQLGIEALSRGAAFCDFVDRGTVHNRDFAAFLPGIRRRYDLIFLDPPYALPALEQALELIAAIDIVSGNGIIVCESALDKLLPELDPPYAKGKEYRYGKIKLTLYHRSVDPL